MHVTVVVKCELCYLFLFDSCWCIQSYCSPDNEVIRQIKPVKSRVCGTWMCEKDKKRTHIFFK